MVYIERKLIKNKLMYALNQHISEQIEIYKVIIAPLFKYFKLAGIPKCDILKSFKPRYIDWMLGS